MNPEIIKFVLSCKAQGDDDADIAADVLDSMHSALGPDSSIQDILTAARDACRYRSR